MLTFCHLVLWALFWITAIIITAYITAVIWPFAGILLVLAILIALCT